MRVLYILDRGILGGIQRHVQCLAKSLQGVCDVAVMVFGPEGTLADQMRADRSFLSSCVMNAGRMTRSRKVCYAYRERLASVSHQAVTGRHIIDTIRFTRGVLLLFNKSGRVFESRAVREYANLWAEWSVYHMFRLPASERSEVWRFWRDSLPDAACMGEVLTTYRRLMFRVCGIFAFPFVARCLGSLPHRIKLLGIHR